MKDELIAQYFLDDHNKRYNNKDYHISPSIIEIILFYYCDGSGEDFMDSPNFKDVSKMLVKEGMLIHTPEGKRMYEPNRDMLEVYVNHLCSIPFPKQIYVIPDYEK